MFMKLRREWVEVLVAILTILEGLREHHSNDETKVDGCGGKGVNPGKFCSLLI